MPLERRRNINPRRTERSNRGDPNKIKVNWNRMVTGHFESVATTLRRKFPQYRRHHKSFKIGISGDPDRRARSYQGKYGRMDVLYKTTSRDYVKMMEVLMVGRYDTDIDNRTGGGGGPVAGPPYYLYIVLP